MTFLSAPFTRRSILSCALALGVLAPSSHVLAQRNSMLVKVPFPFQGGSHTFSAGAYLVQTASDNMILLRSTTTDQIGFAMTLRQDRQQAENTGKLVFHKYGDQYFLCDIWLPEFSSGRHLIMSRAEKQLRGTPAKQPAPDNSIASSASKP